MLFFDFGVCKASIIVRTPNATIRDLLDCPGRPGLRRPGSYVKQEVIILRPNSVVSKRA